MALPFHGAYKHIRFLAAAALLIHSMTKFVIYEIFSSSPRQYNYYTCTHVKPTVKIRYVERFNCALI